MPLCLSYSSIGMYNYFSCGCDEEKQDMHLTCFCNCPKSVAVIKVVIKFRI